MPVGPISPYAVPKCAGELYCQSCRKVFGLETVCLRYFNVFGPRQHSTSPYAAVILKFIRQMLKGEQPTIFGDGHQGRDFTFIDDAISANILACRRPRESIMWARVQHCRWRERESKKIYSVLQKLTGFSKSPLYAPERNGDIRDSLADTSQAHEALGYSRLCGLQEGLHKNSGVV